MRLSGFNSTSTEASFAFGEEAWRFTNLLKQLPAEVVPSHLVPSLEAHVTLGGGEFRVNHLPEGVQLATLPVLRQIYAGDDMAQLPAKQTATLGLRISQSLKAPLRLTVARLGSASHATLASIQVELAAGVKASILQDCSGSEEGLTIQSFTAHLEAGSTLDHALVVREGAAALHVGTFEYRLQESATLHQTALSLGAKMARLQLGVALAGTNAHAHVASLNALTGKSQVDFHSHISHEVAQTFSTQKAKNFLDQESKGIFTGRIHIAPQAQKVEAQQMNRNLLLSKKAHALGQPQLEIYADDVKCAHGSSTGQVEEESTFYLESRGISPKRAQELLAQGFVQEVFQNAQDPELVTRLGNVFQERP